MNIDYTLYLVTNNKNKTEEEFLNIIEESIKGGVTLVQVREKKLNKEKFINIALKVKKITKKYNIPLIINDNIDVAKEIDADGIHVGQSDLDAIKVREIIDEDKILGVSTHNINEAKKAEKDGADYIGCGTIFETPTKSDANIITKEDLINVVNSVNIPVVYIGGLNKDNIKKLNNSGISGISVVSSIMESENPKKASTELKKEFEKIR